MLTNKDRIRQKKYREEHAEYWKRCSKEYHQKNRVMILKQQRKYCKSEQGQNTINQYNKSDICKDKNKHYRHSAKGKLADAKSKAKRRRKLGCFLMFKNPFDNSEEIDYHHINDAYIVALPKDLHHQYMGKYHRENTMEIVKQIYLE